MQSKEKEKILLFNNKTNSYANYNKESWEDKTTNNRFYTLEKALKHGYTIVKNHHK